MPIFAPKCDRCGQRTRNEEEGKPICDNCAQEMQLILDAAEENLRLCPVDASPMKKEIAHRDFDVALIGAGAYGLFLATECKRLGKVGIHIGGATQLLFGILGKRWTDPSSPDSSSVLPFINEHWTGPANWKPDRST